MIELKNRQILIDGKATLILSGEIHYFRLPQSEWEPRILEAKKVGLNAIASYIPWLCHEEFQGKFDFESEHYNLGKFIDLCAKHDLWFIPRPGPFIMAEMKNEGLPYWVYEKYPELIPVGFHGQKATTATLDILNPVFLALAENWYAKVAEVLRPRLEHILAIQLDNEIGMLSWVSNVPELTDFAVADFQKRGYLCSKLSADEIRNPDEEVVGQLRLDLGDFFRKRYADYVKFLQETFEKLGIIERPFIINVHGMSAGRGLTYPIGISQLYEAYSQNDKLLAASDYYFGDFDMTSFQDIYICNELMKAANRPEQPVASMEFNCGDGNFGDNLGGRLDISAADLKGRLTLAQNNRLINYYLFSGGYNYEIESAHDGNQRFAITGERHGFAAPLSPEGKHNYSFERLAESIQTAQANAEFLETAEATYDDLSFAFIPEYYMTDFVDHESEKMTEIVRNIEQFRNTAAWENLCRSLLLLGYRFDAVDIQNHEIKSKNLIIATSEYLSANLQQKLVDFVKAGGNLILYGVLPRFDDKGENSTILIDALGIKPVEKRFDGDYKSLSVVPVGDFSDFAEVRTYFAQLIEIAHKNTTEIFLKEKTTGKVTAAITELGKGKVAFLTTTYSSNLSFFERLMEKLNIKHGLSHNFEDHGILMGTSQNQSREKMLHLYNLDGFEKEFQIFENGQVLFDGGKIRLDSHRALMLPINQRGIVWATGEIAQDNSENELIFRAYSEKVLIQHKTLGRIELLTDKNHLARFKY
ncbi:MAG: beta-galactosidase [Streptococcaceae bacterium]|jgi:beta-galactosidase|nr:beta-galactosidase [Streptococcaceae bacterium]